MRAAVRHPQHVEPSVRRRGLAAVTGLGQARQVTKHSHGPRYGGVAALALLCGFGLSGCEDDPEVRKAYQECLAKVQDLSPRQTKAFCDCLKHDDNFDLHAAHPAEECAEKAAKVAG